VAGGREHRLDGLAIQSTSADLGAKLNGSLLGRERRAMGARLPHRLVRVGGAEQPRRTRDRRAREAARIAGTVKALAVLDGSRGEWRKRLRLPKHPLGQVRLKADALRLAGTEPSTLVEDRVGDTQAAEAVHESRTPQRAHLVRRQPVLPRSFGHQRDVECPRK
jgi:hypothetical protein